MSSAIVALVLLELTVKEEGMSVFVAFNVLSVSCVVLLFVAVRIFLFVE